MKGRQKIVSLTDNKYKVFTSDQGEVIRQRVFVVGYPSVAPCGDMDKVIGIEEKEYHGMIAFDINYSNGETLTIHPVPPFDIGRAAIKAEDGQKNN